MAKQKPEKSKSGSGPARKFKASHGFFYIGAGVVAFLFRYIPMIKVNAGFMTSYYSISEASNSMLCNNPLAVANMCTWVKPLNIFLIVAAVLLAAYGGFVLYKSKD